MKMNKVLSAALLIASTCIGAGMLALPVSTAALGFVGSLFVLALCWAMMAYTGLLTLEVNLRLPEGSNFISMARQNFGKSGAGFTWVVYLLLLYSLVAAHFVVLGGLLQQGLHYTLHLRLADSVSSIPWFGLIIVVVLAGTARITMINRVLMAILLLAYLSLVVGVLPSFHPALLLESRGPSFYGVLTSLAIVITAFGYHVVLPSLRDFLNSELGGLRKTIIIGSLIPFVIYSCWELVIFTVMPLHGPYGLLQMSSSAHPVIQLMSDLAKLAGNAWLVNSAKIFMVMALLTSFLGISMALYHCITDGLKLSEKSYGKTVAILLSFLPPLIFTWIKPTGFLLFLSYAGIFVAILHGMLPAAMAYVGRKTTKGKSYQVKGGHIGLLIVMVFSIAVIVAQLMLNWH